jgi:MFS transporter, Spinster family, sphingosine-1-phosphate transporter
VTGSPSPLVARAWLAVGLLWPAALLNYLDRQMLATVRDSVMKDIPSIETAERFGYVMAVFMWVYAVLSPVGGVVGDRFDRRKVISFSLLVWSVVTWATGRAETYTQLLWLRGLMGVSEAFYIPAALALITDFHPGRTRARAVGLHQTGIYAGMALGGIGGYIAQESSWRDGFQLFGAIGVVYAGILFLSLPSPSRGDDAQPKPTAGVLDATSALWGSAFFLLLVAYFTLPAIAGWGIRNWLPTYLGDTFKLKEGPAGLSATGYVTLAQFGGALFGGWVADVWSQHTPRGKIFASAIGTALLAPALVGLAYSDSLALAIAFMVLFGWGWGMFDANNMPILCQIARPEHRATGYGFMNLVSISVGAGATVVMGWMRDKGMSLALAFNVSAGIALLGAALILFVRPRPDR